MVARHGQPTADPVWSACSTGEQPGRPSAPASCQPQQRSSRGGRKALGWRPLCGPPNQQKMSLTLCLFLWWPPSTFLIILFRRPLFLAAPLSYVCVCERWLVPAAVQLRLWCCCFWGLARLLGKAGGCFCSTQTNLLVCSQLSTRSLHSHEQAPQTVLISRPHTKRLGALPLPPAGLSSPWGAGIVFLPQGQ